MNCAILYPKTITLPLSIVNFSITKILIKLISIGANIPIKTMEPTLELKIISVWPITATKTHEIR